MKKKWFLFLLLFLIPSLSWAADPNAFQYGNQGWQVQSVCTGSIENGVGCWNGTSLCIGNGSSCASVGGSGSCTGYYCNASTPSANVQSILGAANYAAIKTLLGYYTSGDTFVGSLTGTASGNLTLTGTGLIESRGAILDGGGAVIPNNLISYLYFPYAGTISKVTTICNAGDSTLAIDILRLAFSAGNTLPTASMIGSGNYPAPTTAESQITPNGSWTSKTIVAGDVLAIKVTNVAATATWCNVSLDVTR
jgi:hypothetical protein